jgi:hypothetical protein
LFTRQYWNGTISLKKEDVMKKKYRKVIEGYQQFIDAIKCNLEKNNGFISLKVDKYYKVTAPMTKAFLALKKEAGTKVFELAKEQFNLGDAIIKEMIVDKKTFTGKPKSYKTIDDSIQPMIEEYENFLNNEFIVLLEKI